MGDVFDGVDDVGLPADHDEAAVAVKEELAEGVESGQRRVPGADDRPVLKTDLTLGGQADPAAEGLGPRQQEE
ncbi:MAG TPA: hypothetical protein VIK91_06860 [Nannocystis sp.]